MKMTVLLTMLAAWGVVSACPAATPRAIGNQYQLDISLSGTVIATRACYLDPGTADIELRDDGIVDKMLYAGERTRGKVFSIDLLNCDVSLGRDVVLTFSGTQGAVPGYLVPDDNVPPSGLVIGLESQDGTPVPFNQPVTAARLNDGDNHLILRGFIQAEPGAIAAHSIRLGAFTASATFTVSYL